MDKQQNTLLLQRSVLIKILMNIPDLISIYKSTSNTDLKKLIDGIFIYYDKKFSKIYDNWSNNIKLLVKILVKLNKRKDILFLVNNYRRNVKLSSYVNFYAGYYGQIDVVPTNIINYKKLLEGSFDGNNSTIITNILEKSIVEGKIDVIKEIDKMGIKLNYNFIVLYAAIKGILSSVEYGINNGADNINQVAYYATKYNHFDIIKFAFKRGADNENECAVLAAFLGYYDIVKYLIEKGADNYLDIAIAAAMKNNLDIIKLAIKNQPNSVLETTAFELAKRAYLDSVKYLVSQGVEDFKMIGIYGAIGGHKNIVDYAIENGVTDYVDMAKYAAKYGHIELVLYLLNFIHNIEDIELISVYATYSNNVELLKLLVDKGIDSIVFFNIMAITAAKYGKLTSLRFLLKKGADEYYKIASHALEGKHMNIIRYLIKKQKLSIDEIQKLAEIAAELGYIKMVKYFIKHGARNYKDIIKTAQLSENNDIVEYVVDREKKEKNIDSLVEKLES